MAFKKLKYWFDRELAILLANKIENVASNFDSNRFVESIDLKVQGQELKNRVEIIADELSNSMVDSYKQNIATLIEILGPENKEETGMFSNYYWIMPIAKYVEKYGLEDFDTSMHAIIEITKRNTGEYAVRPFIRKYPNRALNEMIGWSHNESSHIRRLSSEGARPRLPWATKLQQFIDDPAPIFPILYNLKDDSSRYVQKSVANCLNDISKDNYELFASIIENWNTNPSPERKWIIHHALRYLRKKEDPWSLSIAKGDLTLSK